MIYIYVRRTCIIYTYIIKRVWPTAQPESEPTVFYFILLYFFDLVILQPPPPTSQI